MNIRLKFVVWCVNTRQSIEVEKIVEEFAKVAKSYPRSSIDAMIRSCKLLMCLLFVN